MRVRTHILLLTGCALCLIVLCAVSLIMPLNFEKKVADRETAVMGHLQEIIRAEERYQSANGSYTPHFGDLIGNGYLADSICVIPYSHGELFSIMVDVEKDASGQNIQTVDCSAHYNQYLEGLDSKSIDNLIGEAGDEGRFPGLSLSRTCLLREE